jgi:saccharopine dehydrogenase (NADP+, L-glutamate forming)
MLHEIGYRVNGQLGSIKSSLIVEGEDNVRTAMAKTVGLPLGIAAKMILQGKINIEGLHIPVIKEIYEPVLSELETFGIRFYES